MKAWVIESQKINEIEVPPICSSLDEFSGRLPGGVYTTFRTYHRTKALTLDDHFNRLEESAGLLGQPVRIERVHLRSFIRGAINLFAEENSRVRITLDLTEIRGRIFIALEKLIIPSIEEYTGGVKTRTRQGGRSNPRAKATAFIKKAGMIRSTDSGAGINEILMVDGEGNILEGLSSNFFGIREGKVFTAEAGVLAGVTRKFVLEVIASESVPAAFQPVSRAEIPLLEEAFLTSASRGILPVAAIDSQVIGKKCPGPLTARISEAYAQRLEQVVEEI